jgi:hypothetical protein
MPNNRRGFVIGSAAGLTAILAPNVAQACFCRRCRHASAELLMRPLPSTLLCPTWSTTQVPSIPDALHMTANPAQHSFTIYGAGLHAWFQGGGVFIPSIVDNNFPNTVSWGSYNYPPVTQGMGSNPDQFLFNASETGSTPGATGSLTITVLLSFPGKACPGIIWPSQQVTYA